MDYLIVFNKTEDAIVAEKKLARNNIIARVMPMPPKIRAGCGIALRIKEKHLLQAYEALESIEIKIYKIIEVDRFNLEFIDMEIDD